MPRLTERISLILLISIVLAGIVPRMLFFAVGPGPTENQIGEILVVQFQLFLTIIGDIHRVFSAQSVGMLILFILLLIFLVRIVHFYQSKRSLLPPESVVLLAIAMVFMQFFFDLSYPLMLQLILVLICLPVTFLLFPNLKLRMLLIAAVVISAATPLWLDWGESIAMFLFSLITVISFLLMKKNVLSRISGYLLLIFAVPMVQLFSAWIPSTLRYTPGQQFTKVFAMSFCESKSQNALITIHPQCPMAMFAEKCRDGYIGVYDRHTLQLKKKLNFFDDNFYGRPEQLICHNDKLFIGMNAVRMSGEILGPNTMLVDLGAAKTRYWKNFGGPHIGNHLLYDPVRDALFLTAEFNQEIHRWDFKKQKMDTQIGDQLPNPWFRPLTGTIQSGSLISHHDAISEKRDTGYFAEWINGRFVHELNLVTLKAERHFRFNGGASVGATVDDAENKLWVTHLWGVSVFDLVTGQLLAKHRAGFVNRPVVIDKENDLVFLAATASGRLHVFERKTFRPITTLALGTGARYLYISADLRRLYASSWSGSYAFDLDTNSAFMQSLRKHRKDR